MQTLSIEKIKERLTEELESRKTEILNDNNVITQVIDNQVPVHNYELLEVADNDKELGEFDNSFGEPLNAFQVIETNIETELTNVAHEWLENLKDK